MSLTTGEMSAADLAAVVGNGNNGLGGMGEGWWIILLFLVFGGGWGNGFGGNNGGAGALYPWMNQAEVTQDGFRDQMINGNLNSIRDGITGISTQLCNGFAGVNAGVANGFAQAEIAANGRQMANMNQLFGLSTQFADCCCENRLANCQTQNIIQNEGNATRFADANNTRDIIQSISNGNQAILDKLCQLELDGVKNQLAQAQRENVGLQNQLNMANFERSQVAQTADLRASDAVTANQLVQELRSCPIPSMPVYGQTPIFTCPNNNSGCGCGCGVA